MNIIKTQLKNININKIFFFVAAFIFLLFVLHADTVKSAISNSLQICATVIIPSLFPMLVISRLINSVYPPEFLLKTVKFPLQKLFGLSENCFQALLTGLTGGYPVGVKNAVTMYNTGKITLREAQKLSLFCVSPGVAFSVSVIGSCLFGSNKIGISIFISNTLACFTLAFLLRNKGNKDTQKEKTTYKKQDLAFLFTESISGSVSSIISICAWICFFSAINALINIYITSSKTSNILLMFSEVTSAVTFFAEQKNVVLAAFSAGFSGLCITFQLLPDLNFLKVKLSSFLFSRLFCGTLSGLYEYIILKISPLTIQTVSQSVQLQLSKYSVWGSLALLFLSAVFIFSSSSPQKHITN